jgi:hypothetical protein
MHETVLNYIIHIKHNFFLKYQYLKLIFTKLIFQ